MTVAERLGKNGFFCVLTNRGGPERSERFKPMFDVGQFVIRDNFSIKSERFSDEELRQMIQHTNLVINCLGAKKPYNHYEYKEVYHDWPVKLAKLVAEKNDGTRLINVAHLNVHDEESRAESNILKHQWNGLQEVQEIYPEAIQVRSSFVFGHYDHYMGTLMNHRWRHMNYQMCNPVLLNGGKNTFHRNVNIGDLAEAIIRISKHPDSPGHTFEIVNDKRYMLNELVEAMYELNDDKAFLFNGIQTKFNPETMLRTGEPKGPLDSVRLGLLNRDLDLMVKPRLFTRGIPRFFDMWSRAESNNTPFFQWVSKSWYYMLNQTDKIENINNPGLADLGIKPLDFKKKLYSYIEPQRNVQEYRVNNKFAWPKLNAIKNYPEGWEIQNHKELPATYYDKVAHEVDREDWNWKNEEQARRKFTKWLTQNKDLTVTDRQWKYSPSNSPMVTYRDDRAKDVVRGLYKDRIRF